MSAAADHGKLVERLDALKRKKDVDIEALALAPKDLEGNATYSYYTTEQSRLSKKRETDTEAIDSKIRKLEAKKQATIDDIDAQISALESKKGTVDDTISTQAFYYHNQLESLKKKIQNPEPDTLAFRKLKSDITRTEADIIVSEKKMRQLHYNLEAASERRNEKMKREAETALRQQMQLEHIQRMEALTIIERQQAAVRKEEEERNKRRVQEAIAAQEKDTAVKKHVTFPTEEKNTVVKKQEVAAQKVSWPLIPGKQYTMDQLWSLEIDFETITEEEEEVYERAKAAASKREKVPGWWDNRYNIEEE